MSTLIALAFLPVIGCAWIATHTYCKSKLDFYAKRIGPGR